MRAWITRNIMVFALVLAPVLMAGCYVEPVGGGPVVVADYGYEPMYYDGYLVYYDPAGRPFYYVNGIQVWVPPASPYYARYVNHWRVNAVAYRRWHSAYGTRYRTVRVRGGYYGGHRHAPVRVRRHR